MNLRNRKPTKERNVGTLVDTQPTAVVDQLSLSVFLTLVPRETKTVLVGTKTHGP